MGGGRQPGATFRLVYTTPLLQHQAQLGLDPALPGAYKVTVSAVYQCDITLIELVFFVLRAHLVSTVSHLMCCVTINVTSVKGWSGSFH